tara:strand:- start:533 stop:685 length:153 start_codon:yes stop_codon:yes gene_type:complete
MKETIIVYIMFLVSALIISNCGIFPAEEVYHSDESINDNSTTSYTVHIGE